jgi:Ferritin-like
VAVTDPASAQRALDTILEQGEGARGHWEAAHFGQFVEIPEEYRRMIATNPAFDPVRPVMFAKVRRGEHDDSLPLIGDRVTSQCTDLFNVSYEILLQILERYFAHTEGTDGQLATLAHAAVTLMGGVLRPLGELITTLPSDRSTRGATRGRASSASTRTTTSCLIGHPPGRCSRSACVMPRPSAVLLRIARRRTSRARSEWWRAR